MRRSSAIIVLLLAFWTSPSVADPLGDGSEAWERGDLPTALVQWTDALVVARQRADVTAERDLLLRLSAVHRELGRLKQASELIDMAGELAKKKSHRADVQVARGRLALSGGELDKAEAAFQSAYQGYREGSEPRGAANAALNLGLARLDAGKHEQADKAFTVAHSLFRLLGDDRGKGDALTNRALVARRVGDLRRARTGFEHAIALYRGVGYERGEADALTNLALVLERLGHTREAGALLLTALDTAQDRKDVGMQGQLHFNLGTLAHRGLDADTALRHYRLAETAFTEVQRHDDALNVSLNTLALHEVDGPGLIRLVERAKGSKSLPLRASVLVRAASMMVLIDPKVAQGWERAAGKLADRLELADVRWQVLYLRGRRLARSGDSDGAAKALSQAVDVLERERSRLDGRDVGGFVKSHNEVYRALMDAQLAADQPLRAMVTAERMQISGQPKGDRDDAQAQRYQQLVVKEAWLQRQVAAEVQAGGDETERAKKLRAELSALRVTFAETIDSLRASYANFDQLVRVDPEDLESIQADLPPEVTVLQPVLFEDRMVLLLFRHDKLLAVTVDVTGEQLEHAVQRLTRALRAGMTDRALLDPLADKLGALIVGPVAEHLQTTETLVVSASGPFRQIPFALLRHDGEYVVQRMAVVGVTHVGSLRAGADAFELKGRDLLLVGNPDGSLPGAEAEVRAIAASQPGATLLVGDQGTRSAFLSRAQGKRVVHLATHGRVDPVQPDRSHLVLAGGDGRLAYREIPGLQPWLSSARLLVLSACESGLPVDAPGGGGVVSINGLASQFRRAGVETLLASLWKVDDDGTQALMRAFYAKLQEGDNIGQALRDAQLSLLNSEAHSSPWYWAAFIIMGDWR